MTAYIKDSWGRTVPNKGYQRFDWRTPGSALKQGNITNPMAGSRARDLFGVTRTNPQDIASAVKRAIAGGQFALGGAQPGGGSPELRGVLSSAKTNTNDLAARDFLTSQGLNRGSSDAQLASGLDAYWRSQQFENQKPKRGITDSIGGKLALGALFSAFGAPLLSGALGAGVTGVAASPVLGGGLGSQLGTIAGGIKNSLSGAFSGGGFTNPSGLGLSGSNLGLNFASGSFPAAPVTGYGASGLGLTGANLGLNFAGGALPALPVNGYGAGALAGDAASLYQPQTLGGATTSGIGKTLGKVAGKALDVLSPAGQISGEPQTTESLSSGSLTALPLTGGTGNPALDRYNYAMTDALTGRADLQGVNALGRAGSGRIALTQRDMQRNPGYQPRPFANYLMRA